MYFVHHGNVQVSVNSQSVGLLKYGDFFGEDPVAFMSQMTPSDQQNPCSIAAVFFSKNVSLIGGAR